VQHSYWRGRTWIHGDTWYLGALWQSGFRQEADELADRILAAVGRGEGICECYDSLTGFGNGHPEFMWSSAAVLLLAQGFYRRLPVADQAAGPSPSSH
jgi:glycogen debranching enzyme